ncbi:hypothetical protein D9Q98_001890 [Chlorella vulgaris]|uniref:Uncharacterized protein n=1 Tax=Chlorella vulgaris TaxID=3077 RepID=A0A9D4TWK7_CHLVU|nr:hypothetical protein D9Q98_001890 [Chlorella vulgaris]
MLFPPTAFISVRICLEGLCTVQRPSPSRVLIRERGNMRRSVAPLAVAVCLALLAGPAAGALLAIDLGSEFLKLSVVKAGRIPISIVINEMSRRKTPALVAFVEGDRLVGEEAASMAVRYPERVYARVADLLGRPADDPRLAAALKAAHRPYSLVPAVNRTSPAAAGVQTDRGETVSAEELVASVLEYAKHLAEVSVEGSSITDCVLTVPASFTQQQRQALLDAAKLAGLNVMGLIHNHAAAALQYGIDRDFANHTETLVVYDLGAASLQAALVSYSAYTNSRGVSTSQAEVLDVVWREDVGGEQLELVLVEHFADEFNAQLGGEQDVRSAPRAMAKLRKQVARTKHVLSANSEAGISVEELWQDRDFRSSITRERFEQLAGDFWARAVEPVTTLLRRNNLTAADITAFELLGGTSRVPAVKQALSAALGGRTLDMHLDADEAVVLGAGLFAANLSTTFRLRQFGLTDKVPYSINVTLEGEEGPRVLVPAMKRLPTKRALHLHNLTADTLPFTLHFDNLPGAVPCCRRSFPLAAFSVSGMQSVAARYNDTGKVSIHARVDQSGLFHVDHADATVEVWEAVPPPPPPPPPPANASANSTAGDGSSNSTTTAAPAPAKAPSSEPAGASSKPASNSNGNTAAAGDGTGDGGAAAVGDEEATPPPLLRKRAIKVPLNLTGGFLVPGMNRSELDASRRSLRRMRAADQAKRERARALNDLESYILATREKVEGDEEVAAVSTEEQRAAFLEQLAVVEDWLYGEGEEAEAAEYRARLRTLREVGDRVFERAAEAAARPQVLKLADGFVELVRKAANSWPDMKPWLNASDVAALVAKVDNFSSWLTGKQAEQAQRAPHEDPAFKAEEVTSWMTRLQQAFSRLNNKKQPKPPPPPPPPKVLDANATAADGNATAGAGGDGTGSAGGQQQDKEAHDELRR